jgi:hypothetical protein
VTFFEYFYVPRAKRRRLAVLVVIDNDFPPGFWARYRSMVIMA